MNYRDFLLSKKITTNYNGIEIDKKDLNDILFDYQKDVVKIALRKMRYGMYLDTGLGKTFILLEIARLINKEFDKKVLIISPLAVLSQTIREAKKLDIVVSNKRNNENGNIEIINYEQSQKIDENDYIGVILDESSSIKSYNSYYKTLLIDKFKNTKFKYCLSATPSPNDNEEIGNQAEFLGIMRRREMLSTFFINDLGDTQKWRLKNHAKKDYFDWLSSWAVFMTNPENLGYKQTYHLPKLNIVEVEVQSSKKISNNDLFFEEKAESLDDIRDVRKKTLDEKVLEVYKLVMS